MTTTKLENRKVIKVKTFNRGWSVSLCPEGAGYSVRLAQFNGEVKSWFRFDKDAALTVFDQVINELKLK